MNSEARTANCASEYKPIEADEVVESDVDSVIEEPAYSLAGDDDDAVDKAFGLRCYLYHGGVVLQQAGDLLLDSY